MSIKRKTTRAEFYWQIEKKPKHETRHQAKTTFRLIKLIKKKMSIKRKTTRAEFYWQIENRKNPKRETRHQAKTTLFPKQYSIGK
jgi:hypothetical protein